MKLFKDAKDKHVAAYVIYVDNVDNTYYACSDSELKNKMTAAELEDAFLKRSLISLSDSYMVPTTIVLHNDSTPYAYIPMEEDNIYSKEYADD